MSEEAKSTTTTKVTTGEENKVQDSHQDEQKIIVDTTNNLDNTTSSTTRKQRLESITTSGMNDEQRNIDAFYEVMWPILEKEGGWTLVKGTGDDEGLSIFCPPGGAVPGNLDIPQISNDLLLAENTGDDNDDANSHQTPPPQPPLKHHSNIPELVHQQGPWTCICGITNEEGTIRCEECFGWRESSATTTTTTTTGAGADSSKKKKKKTAPKKQEYYTKIRHVLEYILQTKETEMDIKAAEAYIGVISNAMELFGESSTNNNNINDDIHNHHHHSIPMSPNGRMTRQRFSDIAWKENRTHYEKNSSRVGVEYQVDSLPVVGSHMVPEEEVLYDQVWDPEKAQKSGKIDFIDHRVKSSIKEPAYDMLHQRNYQLPGFFDELVSKANPTDCSHWTSEERAKFRKLVFEKHEDMWQISEALGRPVRECVTYYLGKFKTSKDFRSLRRVMEKARDENPFKYPGEILCDKCGKGGKLVYCDTCDSHYHLTCQDPPLTEVPEGNDWKCNKCVQKKKMEEEVEDEDTSNGVDTSNYGEEEAEVSSFEGKRSDTVDGAGNNQDESSNKKKEVVSAAAAVGPANNDANNATNDAQSYSSVSAGGGGEGKRPNSGEPPTDDNNVPTPSAKKAKSSGGGGGDASNHNNNFEEDTSMTSFVSDEVSGVDSEMISQQQQQQQSRQQHQADSNEQAP